MIAVTTDSMREMERMAIAAGVPEYTLMRRAGVGAAELIDYHYPQARRFVILCGSGNNGGDALVVAGTLAERGRRVRIFSTADKERFRGAAACAVKDLPSDIPFEKRDTLNKYDFLPGDVIVDGILGIGFNGGMLRDAAASFINAANKSNCPVVALDLPSGTSADDGTVAGNGAISADLTVTFGSPKTGLFCGECCRLRGTLRVVDIGLPPVEGAGAQDIFTNLDAVGAMKKPEPYAHKNSRGRVLVWGGCERYPGAPALCASAALHSGAGIVRLFSPADMAGRVPNAVISHKLSGTAADCEILNSFFDTGDVLVAGCGWGNDVPPEFLECVLSFPGKVVLDADGLNLLSRHIGLWHKRENVIFTPHPGEAARLAAAAGIEISDDREGLAVLLADKFGATVVLKGRDSVVSPPYCFGKSIVAAGSAALATAGSGDVLAGVIGAFAANDDDMTNAASLAAFVHGIAGECADGIPCADDLIPEIGRVIRCIRANGIL